MRKVSARELHSLGVKSGPDIPLPVGSEVELAKAEICQVLEKLHGDDKATWIQVLRRAKKNIKKEPYHAAICQLLAQLEASLGKERNIGMLPPPKGVTFGVKGANRG